jgi:hypothetical protein
MLRDFNLFITIGDRHELFILKNAHIKTKQKKAKLKKDYYVKWIFVRKKKYAQAL